MSCVRCAVLALTGVLWAGAALGEARPRAVKADARIKTVVYDKDDVFTLEGTPGVSTMVVFGEDEKIATVAMGDSLSWQAVPDQSKRFLFIKPLEPGASTDMNVVTNRRIYTFVLRTSGGGKGVLFKLRFVYPGDIADAALMARAKALAAMPSMKSLRQENVNFSYGYKGSAVAAPETAFDDGVKTYFRFQGDVPAIFLVQPDRSETLVNFRREGEILVVDRVAAQWTLRAGADATCVFNLKSAAAPATAGEMTPVPQDSVMKAGGVVGG